jgi:hypothetical protein
MLTPRPFIGLRILVLGLGFFSLLALFATDAHAGCPPPTGFRYIGGACYYVKGVEIEAEVNHTGSLTKDPKTFAADITVQGNGILFCKNKAGNQPPGQKIVPVPNVIEMNCLSSVTNVVSNKNGGTANVVCTAKLIRSNPPTEDDLSLFDAFCASGQVAVDFVPIKFLSDVTYDATTGNIESARHSCDLPNPETLRWDRAADRPERRAYDCTGPQ